MRLTTLLGRLLGRGDREAASPPRHARESQTHVVILDGTLSTLREGEETNAGLAYKLIRESAAAGRVSVFYEAGIQWNSWAETRAVIEGRGINRQIRRAYGHLASRYRRGDRILLFGYSRGAYAVRSLAGMIDEMGLLRTEHAIERHVSQAFRHYQDHEHHPTVREFKRLYCHVDVEIDMVGVWDTVRALGIRVPVLWQLTEPRYRFHNHLLGPNIRNGFHALALDEDRVAFEPVLWLCPPGYSGHVEQVWFRGAHGDIGGQLKGFEPARPLSNIPLVWMLGKAEACGLPLPVGWRDRYHRDIEAPMAGARRGWARAFLRRRPRLVGLDPTECLHPSVSETDTAASVSGPPMNSAKRALRRRFRA